MITYGTKQGLCFTVDTLHTLLHIQCFVKGCFWQKLTTFNCCIPPHSNWATTAQIILHGIDGRNARS
jgi:hypothetical protein